MSSRVIPFVDGQYYHVFNRGVAKMPIFLKNFDYKRFVDTMLYYQLDEIKPRFSLFTPTTHHLIKSKKVVNIISYVLMPNHFHFLLQQVRDGGISEFVSKLSNSYTKYFNTKYGRVGPLLQGQFKAVFIDSDEQLLHVSRYIHLNPLVGHLTRNLDQYAWSSYPEYISHKHGICQKKIILGQFSSKEDYKQFTEDQIEYAQSVAALKHLFIDE